jgi:hypothetical protein
VFSLSVLYSYIFPTSGSFGGVSANNPVFSSFAQNYFSRFSLAFSDTANRFIGDLRQFPSTFLFLCRT